MFLCHNHRVKFPRYTLQTTRSIETTCGKSSSLIKTITPQIKILKQQQQQQLLFIHKRKTIRFLFFKFFLEQNTSKKM